MQLVDVKKTYEVVFEDLEVSQDKYPVFILRLLSAGEVNDITDEVTICKADESFAYLGGTSTRMKIERALVNWKNIEDTEGNPVECTNSNKELLPSKVQQFLARRIDEDNGLVKTEKRKETEKN